MSEAERRPPGGWSGYDPAARRAFRRKLLAWYQRHARDLPWRATRDPYHVWVSEVMLQQTQVETVRPYFERFVAEFPTVADLAAADEERVLRLWEGLGYYRRARALHAAAKRVVEEHAGKVPQEPSALLALPGIGKYTAGAIRSIAFGHPAPILEANTIRLFSRLIALVGDPTKAAAQRRLWGTAEELLPRKDCSRFNQALMELGALVCKPRSPDCPSCPVATLCVSRNEGLLDGAAPDKPRAKPTEVDEAAVVLAERGRVLMRQCGPDERWAGLWDFPRFAIEAESEPAIRQELAEKVFRLTGVNCDIGPRFQTIRHTVTRFRITLRCHGAKRLGGRVRGAAWRKLAELESLPLSVTGRKIAQTIGRA